MSNTNQAPAGGAKAKIDVATCGTCTIRLVELAYRRAPWFRLIREPLRAGMIALSRWHDIDPAVYAVRSEACGGCLRFHKTALKERSRLFRILNRLVNPAFDALLERIVGSGAVVEAKDHARRATLGNGPETS